ncbi:MAG: hypothetical protein RLZZ136_793 [Pseudomonadota bacterium]|jgi:tetratricopeptide (TPR) repeat protein
MAQNEAALLTLRHQIQALRQEQRYVEANVLIAKAVTQFPSDAVLAAFQAQTHYELGLPAAALFARAQSFDPANFDMARNHALALISEGQAAEAKELLKRMLADNPGWHDGLKALATLNWTHGDQAQFADHYSEACHARPDDAALWIAWFRMLAQARDWPAAATVLDQAERHLGSTPAIITCRLFIAVEAHDNAAAEALLAQTAHFRGDVSSLCRIRHALRTGVPHVAVAEALPLTTGPSAPLYWPYLSLAWRLLKEDRWRWLDRPDQLIAAYDIGLSAGDLHEVAELLRSLHTAQAPYIEQSVRGGTQTDRSVLLRHEPLLQKLKTTLLDCTRYHIAQMPAPETNHPLLSTERNGPLLIEGSWSVRLARQGFNVPHTHAMGWLSSACYIALPSPQDMGPAPAGHIAFGGPPPELGLALEPYLTIKPEPGKLVMFPSTTFHGTVPFDDGERLVVAFDIKRPRG